jgi:hypothetical protein
MTQTTDRSRIAVQLALIAAMSVASVAALLTAFGFHPGRYWWDGSCYPGDPTFSYLQAASGGLGAALVFGASVVMMVRGPSRRWGGALAVGCVVLVAWIVVAVTLWPTSDAIPEIRSAAGC